MVDIISKRDKRPGILSLVETGQEITKSGNLWFIFDSIRTEKNGSPEVQTREGETRWEQFIWNYFSEAATKTDVMADILRSTIRGQVRVRRGTDKNLPKRYLAPRNVKW